MKLILGALAAVLLSPSQVVAQPLVRVGIEFQVNTYTTSNQINVAISSDSDGDFVMVWASDDQGDQGR